MGKRPRFGDRLPFEAGSEEEVLEIIDATIEWYAVGGTKGERFGKTLDRVGTQALVNHIRRPPGRPADEPAGDAAEWAAAHAGNLAAPLKHRRR